MADIGGPNARFAIADLVKLQLSNSTSFCCTEFASLQTVAAAYLVLDPHQFATSGNDLDEHKV